MKRLLLCLFIAALISAPAFAQSKSGVTASPAAVDQKTQAAQQKNAPPAAQPYAGCDDKVKKAQDAKAKAKIAYDMAIAEEMIKKPDSVLAMTCFNQAAARSAKNGGKGFSGDFSKQLSPSISQALKDYFKNFTTTGGGGDMKNLVKFNSGVGGSFGGGATVTGKDPGDASGKQDEGLKFDPGLGKDDGDDGKGKKQGLDYSATEVKDGTCAAQNDFWDRAQKEGVNQKVPYVTDEELMSDDPPKTCGPACQKSWKESAKKGVFRDYKKAMEDLPKVNIPELSDGADECEVLAAYGSIKKGTAEYAKCQETASEE